MATPSLRLILLILIALPAAAALAQPSTIHDGPLSDRRVSYRIEASLDPESRTVTGRQVMSWRNTDTVPVEELQFHLYLNAFRDAQSTFMRESGGRHRGFGAGSEELRGGIEILRLTLDGYSPAGASPDLADQLRFIQPDDGNPHDHTAASLMLPEPVEPGATLVLEVDFEAKLPRIVARTGWAEKPNGVLFFMVAQWFPKFGVYEVPGQRYVPDDAPQGAWNTHQFHANSEFYSDFGTYEVTLTTPAHFEIGATGVLTSEQLTDSTRTVTYRADDVHDFAWTAGSDLIVETDRWRHVELRLLLQPVHAAQADRHFEAAKVGLKYFDDWVGEYPYTTLTLVDGLGGSNGMEYPTLITCGTVYNLPRWLRALELVTIHEFGHQYFYGMLASNEFEEAWLDEGINSYLEARIMDAAYGPGSVLDLPGLRIGDVAMQRISYTKNSPSRGAIYTRSWDYVPSSDYGKASYAKPATVLGTLERYLGPQTMERILKEYYERWRFRHPTTRDFIAVARDVSGQDLDWFFDQFVYGSVAVDYAVDRVSSRRLPGVEDADSAATVRYRTEVWLHRREEGVFPQELLLRFEDGSEQTHQWDGEDVWKRVVVEHPSRIAEAYLDPEDRILLDINRLNNRHAARPENRFSRKWQLKVTVWIQQLFFFLGF